MNVSNLPPNICPIARSETRRNIKKNLSVSALKQYELIDRILADLVNGNLKDSLIYAYNPGLIPVVLDPFYPLETAIKLGDFFNVERIFSCFERTMKANYKKEMTECSNMEVGYRPIFWLAAVCDPEKVAKVGRPPVAPETYFKIMKFMELKLGIGPDYQHLTHKGLISRVEYITKFCQNKTKLEYFLKHLQQADASVTEEEKS